MILKRELTKEKNDEMKYSHFMCTLERANQEKLKTAIMELKCVPCLNKFTTNFNILNNQYGCGSQMTPTSSSNQLMSLQNKNLNSHSNMNRLLKQMSQIVSTELQQIAIDLYERIDDDKPVKYIRLKDEFKHTNSSNNNISMIQSQSLPVQQQQQQQQQQQHQSQQIINNSSSQPVQINTQLVHKQAQQQQQEIQIRKLSTHLNKVDLSAQTSAAIRKQGIFNPRNNLQSISQEHKTHDMVFGIQSDRNVQTNSIYLDRV
jgi:hypothetical protein